MEWADKEKMLVQIARTGGELPKALERKPEVSKWLIPYINAFSILSNSRTVGMSVGYIPISEIKAYCEVMGEQDVESFLRIIQAADRAFVEKVTGKGKTKVKSKTKNEARRG